MDDFLQRRPVLLGISLLLALAVWASVVTAANPLVERTFQAETVHLVGSPQKGADVLPKAVDVTVTGPTSVISRLTDANLTVEVDMAGLAPGRHSVSPTLVAPAGVALDSTQPARVTVIVPAGGGTAP